MTQVIINPSDYGKSFCNDPTWANVVDKSGIISPSNSDGGGWATSSGFNAHETFLQFDLSSIPAGSTIDSVVLRIRSASSGNSITDACDVNAYAYTWDGTAEDDFQDTAEVSALSLMATFADAETNWLNSTTHVFSSEASFTSSVQNAIGGNYGMLIVSSRYAAGTTPVSADTSVISAATITALIINYTERASEVRFF